MGFDKLPDRVIGCKIDVRCEFNAVEEIRGIHRID